jgi:hypothetical protein
MGLGHDGLPIFAIAVHSDRLRNGHGPAGCPLDVDLPFLDIQVVRMDFHLFGNHIEQLISGVLCGQLDRHPPHGRVAARP